MLQPMGYVFLRMNSPYLDLKMMTKISVIFEALWTHGENTSLWPFQCEKNLPFVQAVVIQHMTNITYIYILKIMCSYCIEYEYDIAVV